MTLFYIIFKRTQMKNNGNDIKENKQATIVFYVQKHFIFIIFLLHIIFLTAFSYLVCKNAIKCVSPD